jgi:hypothetical protein
MRRLALVLALIVTALAASRIARADSEPDRKQQAQVTSTEDSEKRAGDYLVLPIVYYSPETLLAGGTVGIYYFRLPGGAKDSRPSNIKGDFIYTMKKQGLAQLSPQIYLEGEKYFIDSEFSFVSYFDRYWGRGNDTPDEAQEEYTSNTLRMRLGFFRQLPPFANFGLRYHIEEVTMLDWEKGKQVDLDPKLIGSRYSLITGFGAEFNYDSRDNYFSPTKGAYFAAQALVFTRTLGGTTSYLWYSLDARKYVPTWRGQILALQAYFYTATSGVPFTSLPQLGGINRMRGVFDGRYRDLLSLTLQAEYRVPLFWRFGSAAFMSLGQVAPDLGGFELDGFHLAGGGGVRIMLKESERLLIRFDVGFGSATPSFYFTAHEAF